MQLVVVVADFGMINVNGSCYLDGIDIGCLVVNANEAEQEIEAVACLDYSAVVS